MAKYRALADLYVRTTARREPVRIRKGEEFQSDDVPGRNWQPLDSAAEEAFERHGRRPFDPTRADRYPIAVTRIG